MSDIGHEHGDRPVPSPSVKHDAKSARPPRSKREVAAFEFMRGSSELKRNGGALPKRMSRWKR